MEIYALDFFVEIYLFYEIIFIYFIFNINKKIEKKILKY